MAKQPAVRIELLDGFRALTDGRSLARLPTARQQQLIAFLVLHAHGTPVQRQRLAGSLWPESSDAHALTNLRRERHHLREDWPSIDALIDAGTRTLTWKNARASVDLTDFDAAAERGVGGDRMAMQEAARLYRGDLLPDVTGEWIDPDRERLRLRAQQVLARLVDLLERNAPCGCDRVHAAAAAARSARRAGVVRADALPRSPRRPCHGAPRVSECPDRARSI